MTTATPTAYQARLLFAALADTQHRVPATAAARTLDILCERRWVRSRRLTSTLSMVESGARDYVLTQHGIDTAEKVRAAQAAAVERGPRTVNVEGIGWTCMKAGRKWTTEYEGVKFELERRTRNAADGCPDTGWYLYGGSHFGEYMAAGFKAAAVAAFPYVCPKEGHPQPSSEVQQLAERYPVDSTAVYVPEEGEAYRDVVIVKSGPGADGTVEVLSARQGCKSVRVALDRLQPLPAPVAEPEGEWTEWWTVMDRAGREVARVKGGMTRSEAMEAVEADPIAGPVSRREGGVGLRKLRSSELSIPVGELRGLPRKSAAAAPARLTATVTSEYIGRSIPSRLRAAGVPGQMVNSKTGALRWRLPDGEELTPGEAEARFLL